MCIFRISIFLVGHNNWKQSKKVEKPVEKKMNYDTKIKIKKRMMIKLVMKYK